MRPFGGVYADQRSDSRCLGWPEGVLTRTSLAIPRVEPFQVKGLILAQNERWRRVSYMQVERESPLRGASRVA